MASDARAGRSDEPRNVERIRQAALQSFARSGTDATTMRGVAAAAGVSLGLVQHHFATKAGLIAAVDEFVLELVVSAMARPLPEPPVDSVAEIGGRVTGILAEYPDVADYLSRAMVDGSQVGVRLFDALIDVGTARWQQRIDRGEVRPDVDITWAVINAILLAMGAISLRYHVDRHLPAPLTDPVQLERWQRSVDTLLRDGLFVPRAQRAHGSGSPE
ncbi:TetR/AcrR family transcriptional regulator [Mycolicibacterium sp. 018/SC-01/001]|uniref:TetR/AcrR family transcriptional regulator n=1 Tax=Mycolicibacterium sp. 018/SC-01/001 TaxID=2592069 RepID=UPI002106E29E|nr:TetR/AcrR family transcriptional regulator [Mycolicibacterium sp. 018/SC-01/001]